MKIAGSDALERATRWRGRGRGSGERTEEGREWAAGGVIQVT